MPKGQSYDGEHHGSRSPQSFHKDIAYDDMKLGDVCMNISYICMNNFLMEEE